MVVSMSMLVGVININLNTTHHYRTPSLDNITPKYTARLPKKRDLRASAALRSTSCGQIVLPDAEQQ